MSGGITFEDAAGVIGSETDDEGLVLMTGRDEEDATFALATAASQRRSKAAIGSTIGATGRICCEESDRRTGRTSGGGSGVTGVCKGGDGILYGAGSG